MNGRNMSYNNDGNRHIGSLITHVPKNGFSPDAALSDCSGALAADFPLWLVAWLLVTVDNMAINMAALATHWHAAGV